MIDIQQRYTSLALAFHWTHDEILKLSVRQQMIYIRQANELQKVTK